jgi:type III secretory pathway component EscS
MDIDLLIHGVKVISLLSLFPIVVIACVSFTWSLIQSTTQIQEQTIGHLLRLGVFGILLFFFGQFSVNILVDFTQESLMHAVKSGGSGNKMALWKLVRHN